VSLGHYILFGFILYVVQLAAMATFGDGLPETLPTLTPWQVGLVLCMAWERR
jgi:hypothetical protein